MFATDGDGGQGKRVAGRFALFGMAGELATEYGLTGWSEGAALNAAAELFKVWQSNRGKGNSEQHQVAEQMLAFLTRHGDSRFSAVADGVSLITGTVYNRAGWWRETAGVREYLVTPDAMKEALKGLDFKRALNALEDMGAIPKAGANGERAKAERVDGQKLRLYRVYPAKLEGASNEP
jgi:putative DNA primase/helicase